MNCHCFLRDSVCHSFQLLGCVQLFVTPWTAARQASLSITKSRSLLKLMSIQWVMPSKHLILCRPLLLPPSIFPSIRVFSSSFESVLSIRWPKDWSFSFSICPYNEYSGLISLRMAWFVLLAIQESSLRGQPPNEQNSKHWKPNCCFVIKFHGSL